MHEYVMSIFIAKQSPPAAATIASQNKSSRHFYRTHCSPFELGTSRDVNGACAVSHSNRLLFAYNYTKYHCKTIILAKSLG